MAEKSMTISEFARRINRERSTVYDIFERKSIDVEFLIKISDVLDYDFIHEVYFPQNTKNSSHRILIAIEIDKSDIGKLDLPERFVRLAKQEN